MRGFKVYGTAINNYSECGLTENNKYPILKVRYLKLFPEGLVTTINDNKELIETSSYYFRFDCCD